MSKHSAMPGMRYRWVLRACCVLGLLLGAVDAIRAMADLRVVESEPRLYVMLPEERRDVEEKLATGSQSQELQRVLRMHLDFRNEAVTALDRYHAFSTQQSRRQIMFDVAIAVLFALTLAASFPKSLRSD